MFTWCFDRFCNELDILLQIEMAGHCGGEPRLKCANIQRSFKATWTVYLVVKAIARFIFVFLNNVYGISTYLIWMCVLRPLLWHQVGTNNIRVVLKCKKYMYCTFSLVVEKINIFVR